MNRGVIVRMTRFSLRFLLVVALVVAAYASGRGSMERRTYLAEAESAAVRNRAVELEARLRTAETALAAVHKRPTPSNWPSERRALINSRWAIYSTAANEDQHAAHLDSLGIKLIGLTEGGTRFQVLSDFSASLTIEAYSEVPSGFVMIDATEQDHLLLVRSGSTVSMSGIARLIPLRLADELVRAEAEFMTRGGRGVNELAKTLFNVSATGLGKRAGLTGLRARVTGFELVAGKTEAPIYSPFVTPQ